MRFIIFALCLASCAQLALTKLPEECDYFYVGDIGDFEVSEEAEKLTWDGDPIYIICPNSCDAERGQVGARGIALHPDNVAVQDFYPRAETWDEILIHECPGYKPTTDTGY